MLPQWKWNCESESEIVKVKVQKCERVIVKVGRWYFNWETKPDHTNASSLLSRIISGSKSTAVSWSRFVVTKSNNPANLNLRQLLMLLCDRSSSTRWQQKSMICSCKLLQPPVEPKAHGLPLKLLQKKSRVCNWKWPLVSTIAATVNNFHCYFGAPRTSLRKNTCSNMPHMMPILQYISGAPRTAI